MGRARFKLLPPMVPGTLVLFLTSLLLGTTTRVYAAAAASGTGAGKPSSSFFVQDKELLGK